MKIDKNKIKHPISSQVLNSGGGSSSFNSQYYKF